LVRSVWVHPGLNCSEVLGEECLVHPGLKPGAWGEGVE
jgi:hypothetical protein